MKATLAFDLPEDHLFVPLVRHAARLLLHCHGVHDDDIYDVETVLGELASNATRHAHSAEGQFHVRLDCHPGRVVLTVTDHGPGLDSGALPPAGTARADADGGARVGGFGLPLVRALADSLEFHTLSPNGTTVIAEKRLRARAASDCP